VPRSLSCEGPRNGERLLLGTRSSAHCGVHGAGDKVQNARTASHYTRIVHSHSQSPHANSPLALEMLRNPTNILCALCCTYFATRERQSRAHGSGAECCNKQNCKMSCTVYWIFTVECRGASYQINPDKAQENMAWEISHTKYVEQQHLRDIWKQYRYFVFILNMRLRWFKILSMYAFAHC
jgi:hypothetical protein